MKKHIKKIKRFGFIKSWMVVSCLVIASAALVGIHSISGVAAASATLSLSPASGTYTTGQTVTVTVNENSGSEAVNAVVADFTYPSSILQFGSINGNSSGFNEDAGSSGGGGTVNITRGSNSGGVTGAQQVAIVTFTVIGTGPAALNFQPNCIGTNDTNCSDVSDATTTFNIISGTTGASYTLQAPTTPVTPVTPVTPTTPSTPSTPAKSTTTSYAASTQTKAKSTSITPSGSVTPVTVPDNSTVQVNQPATVQPATVQDEGVASVQYYLNNKLVYTALSPPYSYKVNTTKLLNGAYTLKTKTNYSSGSSSTTTQTLHVDNPLSLTQAWLFFKKFIMIPLIIIILALVGFFVWRKFHKNHNPFGTPSGHNGGGGDGFDNTYAAQPQKPVIKPTVVVG